MTITDMNIEHYPIANSIIILLTLKYRLDSHLKPNKQLFCELTNQHLCLHRLCMLRPVLYNYTALTIKQTRK
ncbi:hypothetical protein T02_2741, partial [Trichinella nativa]